MQIFLNKHSFKNVFLLLCSVLTLSLTACKDDEPLPEPEPEPVAYISLYQASPDAPDMDILIGNQKANNQVLRYTSFYEYSRFQPGEYRFRFNPASAANSYIDSTFTVEEKVYSLFTVGRFQELDLLIVEDSVKVPSTGKAGIRLIHLSPDAPNVDVVTSGTNGKTLFSNVGFKQDTDFIELEGGTHSILIREAGGEALQVSLPGYNVVPGRVFTLLLRGFKNPPAGSANNAGLNVQVIQNL